MPYTESEIQEFINTNLADLSPAELLELANVEVEEISRLSSTAFIYLLKQGQLQDLRLDSELWIPIKLEQQLRQVLDVKGFLLVDDSHTHGRPYNYGSHYRLTIMSPDLNGLTKVKAHQQVIKPLKDLLANQIHALAIKVVPYAPGAEENLTSADLVKCAGVNH